MNETVDMKRQDEVPALPLYVAQSRPNKRLFYFLIGLTCCIGIGFDVFLLGRFGIVTVVLVLIVIWQGLRTYVFRAVFTEKCIEYRSVLGVAHMIEYSKIMVLEDRGESIILFGENLRGKTVKFSLYRRDGNLDAISEFLHSRTLEKIQHAA
jgi:hypothetical protein